MSDQLQLVPWSKTTKRPACNAQKCAIYSPIQSFTMPNEIKVGINYALLHRFDVILYWHCTSSHWSIGEVTHAVMHKEFTGADLEGAEPAYSPQTCNRRYEDSCLELPKSFTKWQWHESMLKLHLSHSQFKKKNLPPDHHGKGHDPTSSLAP